MKIISIQYSIQYSVNTSILWKVVSLSHFGRDISYFFRTIFFKFILLYEWSYKSTLHTIYDLSHWQGFVPCLVFTMSSFALSNNISLPTLNRILSYLVSIYYVFHERESPPATPVTPPPSSLHHEILKSKLLVNTTFNDPFIC